MNIATWKYSSVKTTLSPMVGKLFVYYQGEGVWTNHSPMSHPDMSKCLIDLPSIKNNVPRIMPPKQRSEIIRNDLNFPNNYNLQLGAGFFEIPKDLYTGLDENGEVVTNRLYNSGRIGNIESPKDYTYSVNNKIYYCFHLKKILKIKRDDLYILMGDNKLEKLNSKVEQNKIKQVIQKEDTEIKDKQLDVSQLTLRVNANKFIFSTIVNGNKSSPYKFDDVFGVNALKRKILFSKIAQEKGTLSAKISAKVLNEPNSSNRSSLLREVNRKLIASLNLNGKPFEGDNNGGIRSNCKIRLSKTDEDAFRGNKIEKSLDNDEYISNMMESNKMY